MEGISGGYSIRDGYMAVYSVVRMQTGVFLSERRCPTCRSKMNTNGDGRFMCSRCDFHDVKDISRLKASDIDYPIPNNKRAEAIRHGLGIWD